MQKNQENNGYRYLEQKDRKKILLLCDDILLPPRIYFRGGQQD